MSSERNSEPRAELLRSAHVFCVALRLRKRGVDISNLYYMMHHGVEAEVCAMTSTARAEKWSLALVSALGLAAAASAAVAVTIANAQRGRR